MAVAMVLVRSLEYKFEKVKIFARKLQGTYMKISKFGKVSREWEQIIGHGT